jgi:hypothetical protein
MSATEENEMNFNEDECYELFLAVDDRARDLPKVPPELLSLRQRLMSIYTKRHGDTGSTIAAPIEPPEHPFGFSIAEMDVEAFFNMRDWLTTAVEAKGAKRVGGGIGMGQADIDVDLDGCRYNISIQPLPRS